MENLMSQSFHTSLKNFIITAKQYSLNHNESSSKAVLCSLQILGQSNQFVFDSKNILIQEFYITLYEMMNTINDDSIMWASINVLQSFIKQGYFDNTKLNNYKFTLILSKLLKDELTLEKKIKILKLLQDLTYGAQLQWQESYLTELIMLLVKWISSEDRDLKSFSLGILMNVCCKNKFAIFTLVKYTDSKHFMRLLLKLQSDDIFIRVQVYKLLLVLEQVSGHIPNVETNYLVDIIFIVLEEGLKHKNVFVLRHVIDFFVDISEHSSWKNSVLNYSNYKSKLINLLKAMEDIKQIEKSHNNCDITFQSVELIFKFIHHVTQFQNESVFEVYPEIIIQILHWTQYLDVFEQTVLILQAIIINVRNNSHIGQNLQCDIYEKLEESLNVLFIFVSDFCITLENATCKSVWNKYAVCFKLLRDMLKLHNLYEKIEEKLSLFSLQSIFNSFILIDLKDLNNLKHIAFVYIEVLCFLSDLVANNPTWMSLFSEVLNQKHVYYVLAFIMYNGSKNMKQKVLELVTKFSQQSILMLSDCLEKIEEQLSSIEVKSIKNTNSLDTEENPLCSFSQEEQLQMYIDKLENMFNSNKIHNINTSNVIKLYQYKINASKQSEVWLKKSIDNASEEITRLNYKIHCLNSESTQINQMLLENHQAIDGLTMENCQLKDKLNDITNQFLAMSNNFKKLTQNYESKSQIVQQQNSTIKNLEGQLKKLQENSNKEKTNLLEQLQNEKNANKMQVSKLEQQLIDSQIIINEKTEEIDSKISFIKNLENCILEKDKDVLDLRKQLQEQHRVREMISQMLAATSSKP
ncbi:Armadillo-type fold,Armadillo-like helical [Cinara cedri]|uniref:Armadillo-type fold,Armadillo-like helical n=1 Tax=Cinara cedri TaxID=506608 RepID=A0A5E4MHS5_9HEMI|nr:Armadillo-type fold,Armadillo-like helical [Cinara cedri]